MLLLSMVLGIDTELLIPGQSIYITPLGLAPWSEWKTLLAFKPTLMTIYLIGAIFFWSYSMRTSTSVPTLFLEETVEYDYSNQAGECVQDPYSWICSESNCDKPCQHHLPQVLADASNWTVKDKHSNPDLEVEVKFCSSQRTPKHCKLQFSLQIVIVVIVINTLKIIRMMYVVFGLTETPLMTIGDAIASFLNEKDPTTKGCCLVSKFDIKLHKLQWQHREGQSNGPPAKEWSPTKVPWALAVGRTRWWACGMMFVLPEP